MSRVKKHLAQRLAKTAGLDEQAAQESSSDEDIDAPSPAFRMMAFSSSSSEESDIEDGSDEQSSSPIENGRQVQAIEDESPSPTPDKCGGHVGARSSGKKKRNTKGKKKGKGAKNSSNAHGKALVGHEIEVLAVYTQLFTRRIAYCFGLHPSPRNRTKFEWLPLKITGTSRQDLNGTRGRAVDFDAGTGRYTIHLRLPGETSDQTLGALPRFVVL